MTVLDWLIVGVLLFLTFRGYRRGFMGQVFSLLGTFFAVIAAFYFFERAGAALSRILHISQNLANILGFILIAVCISSVFGYSAKKWRDLTKSSALSVVDGLTGAGFGVIKALIILVFVLVLMVNLPLELTRKPVRESFLAKDILGLTPAFFFLQERSLPANVPRLMITPEGLQLRRFNYQELDGATCLACGGKVRYDGLKAKGVMSYPHFTCGRCGRTSDGCQTYEGYHLIYGKCPKIVEEHNCKLWPSPRSIKAKGPCPVCLRKGTEL